jgi:hypothetical protein
MRRRNKEEITPSSEPLVCHRFAKRCREAECIGLVEEIVEAAGFALIQRWFRKSMGVARFLVDAVSTFRAAVRLSV